MINISKNIGKGRVNLLCYEVDKNNLYGSPMKIQEIEITDIGGIPYLKLDNLNPHMNIICGENGVGKTTILDAIAYLFSRETNLVKKRSGSEIGSVRLGATACNGDKRNIFREVEVFDPDEATQFGRWSVEAKDRKLLINVPVNRAFSYKKLNAISPFPNTDNYNYQDKLEGISSDNLKNWFILKHWRQSGNELSEVESYNILKAKEFISKLDDDIAFKRADDFFNIIVTSNGEEIPLEYLSSGFKSAFYILLGILNEIEYMYGKEIMPADQYSGIILIDEIDLHLHPIWQQKIIQILKSEYPEVQFFITTHSPHVVQSAEHNEIIALEKNIGEFGNGASYEIAKRDTPDSSEYGFQGWTIEEILTDVMGMESVRGEAYKEQIAKFDVALEGNDKTKAQEAYLELVKMIHPNSHVRKMLQLEMIGLE